MIRTILASVMHNSHYLNKYINFITNCQRQNESYTGYTEKHHICPKAQDMFPEFTSFKEFPWNCAKLTPRQHCIAHLMLYKAYPSSLSQARALYLLTHSRGIKITSKVFDMIRARIVESIKGKTIVKDTTGKTLQVTITDPRYLSGDLVGVCKNKTNFKDDKGSIFNLYINDPRYLSKELVGISKNKVSVRDMLGNTLQVEVSDPRYISGELVGVTKNKIPVRDKLGNSLLVDKNDSRYLSGELVHTTTGKVSVKDNIGRTLLVDKNDSRYLSGELVGVNKGRVSEKRSLSIEQVKEIKLAIKDPLMVITNDFIVSIVKAAHKDKVGIIAINKLQYSNNSYLSYKNLLTCFYSEKFNVSKAVIAGILDNKTYRQIP